MDRVTEKQLIRLLLGELSEKEARRWRERLGRESDLQQAFSSLQKRWEAMKPPPPPSAPPGFAEHVVRQAVTGAPTEPSGLRGAPSLWARAAAAVALVSGVFLGALLASPSESEEWDAWTAVELTQAEAYWETLDLSVEDFLQEDQR